MQLPQVSPILSQDHQGTSQSILSTMLTSIFLCALVTFIFHIPAVSSGIYSWKWLCRTHHSLHPLFDLHQAEDLLTSSSCEQATPLPPTSLLNTHHNILKDSPAG